MQQPTLSKLERWNRTHERLRAVAGRLLREKGLSWPSLADVMKGAELTVGGFYGHWASKEALFDEVLGASLREHREKLMGATASLSGVERLVAISRRYLSRPHRDASAEGCPLPVALGEIAVTGEPYRATLVSELEAFAGELGAIAGGKKLALGLVALLVGGLTLARATAGTPLSDQILQASRELAALVLKESAP